MRAYRERHHERLLQEARDRYAASRETHRAVTAEYRKNNPAKIAESKRTFFFGKAGNGYYLAVLQEQDGKCAICGRTGEETGRSLGLDHNHNFAAKDPRGWRGLLCGYCNAGIGNFRENLSLLGGPARDYLLKWGAP
jgi:hypothetical protein